MKIAKVLLATALLSLLVGMALAQVSVPVPAATATTQGVVQPDGTTATVKNGILSCSATGGLPSGFTWANGIFTVPGIISGTQLNLTGGAALPPSASGLYLLGLTGTILSPVAYTGGSGGVGPQGPPGPTGPQGSAGPQGPAGGGGSATKYTLAVPAMAAYAQIYTTITGTVATSTSGCTANPAYIGANNGGNQGTFPYVQVQCSGGPVAGTVYVWISNGDGKSHAAGNYIVSIF